jgi:hypothetical protein
MQQLEGLFAKQHSLIMGEMDRRFNAQDSNFNKTLEKQRIGLTEEMDQKMDIRFSQQHDSIMGETRALLLDLRSDIMLDVRALLQQELEPIRDRLDRFFRMESEDIQAINSDVQQLKKEVKQLKHIKK